MRMNEVCANTGQPYTQNLLLVTVEQYMKLKSLVKLHRNDMYSYIYFCGQRILGKIYPLIMSYKEIAYKLRPNECRGKNADK
jgi:hypothetical protein